MHDSNGSPVEVDVTIGRTPKRAASAKVLQVLLTEEAPAIREAVTEMIERDGQARVAFGTDSEAAALRELGATHYDVAIVDLRLREGSGFGVLRGLQRRHADTLVIVLTNYAMPAVREYCAALGATRFLDKSSEFDKVPALISDWARRRGI